MEKSNSRRWIVVPAASWLLYAGGLVIVLLCAAILLYFNLGSKPLPDSPMVLDLSLPLPAVESESVSARETAESGPGIDDAYRRAVHVQIEDLAARQEEPASQPVLVATPSVEQVVKEPVELEVITEGANLNVRSAPGTHSPVISAVATGTRLRALAINAEGTWIQAHVPHLSEPGWLFAGLVRVVTGSLGSLPISDDSSRERQSP